MVSKSDNPFVSDNKSVTGLISVVGVFRSECDLCVPFSEEAKVAKVG